MICNISEVSCFLIRITGCLMIILILNLYTFTLYKTDCEYEIKLNAHIEVNDLR